MTLELGSSGSRDHNAFTPWKVDPSFDGKKVTVSITPSAKAMVGVWKLISYSWMKANDGTALDNMVYTCTHKTRYIILFNPWSKGRY